MTGRITARQLLGAGVAISLSTAAVAIALLWPHDSPPPHIQGALLPEPRPIPAFRMTDHQGTDYSREDLKGQWHLISYGYTHCPDICPATLYQIAEFRRLLDTRGVFSDLQVLFYTVDPKRDTLDRLAEYVPWFDKRFKALRAPNQIEAEAFETGLGIAATVQPADDPQDYQVFHGLLLYLLNERGELRAALKPTKEMNGNRYFEPERLLQDYLAIRQWHQES